MKPREARRKVLIRARMRLGGAWRDLCIRDISSRGMLLQGPEAPPRGTYVEICRGHHFIVGRVAWSKGQRFGVQTQEKLNVDALVAEPDNSGVDYAGAKASDPEFERRNRPRPTMAEIAREAERSRWRARSFEYAFGAAACVVVALMIFQGFLNVVVPPLQRVSHELARVSTK